MKNKECTVCGRTKSINQFYSYNKVKADGKKYIYYRPDCIECSKMKATEWRVNNRDKHRKSTRKWYNNSPEARRKNNKLTEKQKENGYYLRYQRANKDKFKKYNENHISHDISKQEWEDCLSYFKYKCAYCGIPQDEAKEKYNNLLHREHVAHDGSDDLSNCVPACKSCNSRKRTYRLDDWYKDGNPAYEKRRYNKIMKWLDNDYKKYISIS